MPTQQHLDDFDRAILSLLEIHQQADGSILLPKALVPYVGRERIGGEAAATG